MGGEAQDGELQCLFCHSVFPVKDFIPRFVPVDNYAASFGFQWSLHSKTQLDKFNYTQISRDRFFKTTQWPQEMGGQLILDVGAGAGRFTQIALEAGATVFALDYSMAIDANFKNNGDCPRAHFFQGDIYRLPFKRGVFDRIYCLGVLQHTPDVKKAFFSMIPFLKPGGEIVIDVYKKSWKVLFMGYYWLRGITKRASKESLYRWVARMVPLLLPVSSVAGKIPLIGLLIQEVFPCPNYSGVYPLTQEQLLEWSILDTFDRLAPKYDQPQTLKTVESWFKEGPFSDYKVVYGANGIVARGEKKK
jgi:ubiquinone/menaquinone biosynthesis C-methylase UbiE